MNVSHRSAQPRSFSTSSLDVTIGDVAIVVDASMHAAPGEMVGLLGPNGSGKSTLLRAVHRALRPARGAVMVGDDDVWRLKAKQAAQLTAVVAQEATSDFDFTVREVVEMGRGPHKRLLDRDTAEDVAIVDDCLLRVRMERFAERLFATLSGGEKQRVLVARALAQRTGFLLLDEPTNHLDVRAQFELLDLVRDLGVTTIAALHDLNHAARYCDRVYVLRGGRVVAHGPTAEVLTQELLADVFGVRSRCTHDVATGEFNVTLLSALDREASPCTSR